MNKKVVSWFTMLGLVIEGKDIETLKNELEHSEEILFGEKTENNLSIDLIKKMKNKKD